MRKLNKIIASFSTLALVALPSCTYFEEKPVSDSSSALAGKVSFAMVQEKVFNPSCVHCHGSEGGVNLQSYASAASALSEIRTDVFVTRKMPKNGMLTSSQLAILKAWIDESGPEDPSKDSSRSLQVVQIADLNYANVNAKIIKPLCIECHKNGVGVDLQTYEGVRDNASRIAMAVFGDKTMPKKKLMGEPERALLSAWIKAGTPELAPGTTEPILPTYESIRKNIFEPLCMNCHGSGKIAEKKPLAPYAKLMDKTIDDNDTVIPYHSGDSSIMDVITRTDKDRMPKPESNLGSLPQEMVDVIQKWIDSGAPEN